MNTSLKHSVFALAATLTMMTTGCEEWRCGYGGPGCGTPGLRGTCNVLIVNQPQQPEVQYFDDTGGHAATVLSARSLTPALLDATLLDDAHIELTPKQPGQGQILLDVDGWETPPTLNITIVNTIDDLPEDEREDYQTCRDYHEKYEAPRPEQDDTVNKDAKATQQ